MRREFGVEEFYSSLSSNLLYFCSIELQRVALLDLVLDDCPDDYLDDLTDCFRRTADEVKMDAARSYTKG